MGWGPLICAGFGRNSLALLYVSLVLLWNRWDTPGTPFKAIITRLSRILDYLEKQILVYIHTASEERRPSPLTFVFLDRFGSYHIADTAD